MMRTVFAHRACGILYRFIRRNGGRYLLPANICPVVPLTFRLAEVDFEFVDINNDTLCIDEKSCLSLVRRGIFQGLVFVHTYGTPYNPQLFFGRLKSCVQGFHIVDDKCLCVPDFSIPQTEAELTLFSTGYAKYVDMGGGGFGFLQEGVSLSKEPLLYDGSDVEIVYKEAFVKKKMITHCPSGWLDAFVTDLSEDVYRQNVEREVDRMKKHKLEINAVYRNQLNSIQALSDDFNQWRYNILVENKKQVLKDLFDAGLFASSHYQPSSKLFDDKFFPNAQRLYDQVINLFNDKYFTREKAMNVAKIIC